MPSTRAGYVELAAFASVVGLAAVLNAWSLSINGLGNTYYAAAARSMSDSWSNFFFGSFDQGGFITVDKPPVFLWFGAIFVRVFGYSSWAILLPSAAAGTASVALLWLMVRRYFGVFAATSAALVLALTPISVAVNRINLPEPILIVALLGAAFATLRSLESPRWLWWTVAAGALVGVAFNTKMLAGWIPGPALALAIASAHWTGFRPDIRRIAGQLTVLAVATFVFSASWMLIVDNWPAANRPYVGGSADNTVQNLALEYNGVGRVDGEGNGPGGGTRGGAQIPGGGQIPSGGQLPGGGQDGSTGQTGGIPPTDGGGTFPTRPGQIPGGQGQGGTGGQPQGDGGQLPGGGATGARGAGGIIAGVPGLWRMFDDANGPQIAWFLPFSLGGGLLALWYWRRDRMRRAAVVLAIGWVLTFGLVFSFAEGIYHSYYTAAIAPGVAELAGMSVAAGVGLARRRRCWILPFAALAIVTAYLQVDLAGRFDNFYEHVPMAAMLVVGAGILVLALAAFQPRRVPTATGFSVILAGLLLLPGVWARNEAVSAVTNTTLPAAGPRQGGASGQSFGSDAFDSGTAGLAAWLEAHREPGTTWDLAVSSAQNASTLIAEYDLSVMAIGGFSGSDPTITAKEFEAMVENGEIRYVLVGGGMGGGGFGGGGFNPGRGGTGGANTLPAELIPGSSASPTSGGETRGASAVMAAVQSACSVVSSAELPESYSGSLYDCASANW